MDKQKSSQRVSYTGLGVSLGLVFSGLSWIVICAVAWFIPVIRNVEEIMPDQDQLEKANESESQSFVISEELQPSASEA